MLREEGARRPVSMVVATQISCGGLHVEYDGWQEGIVGKKDVKNRDLI